MKHAHVQSGEYEVPLIGIPKTATQQECQTCKKCFHLNEIKFNIDGAPQCKECLSMENPVFTNKEIIDGINGIYLEWCDYKAEEEGNSKISLPDFETAIKQLEVMLERLAQYENQ